jgi:nitric oxide dioxygenase
VLDDAGRPVVFASAGMGISPMAGMLSHLVAAGSGLSITVLHADLDQVDLPDDATYYLCGPIPFMEAVRSALVARGVAPRDTQYEVFGPDLWQADLD